ncbi:MAG: hypothetical protein WAO00_19260 [Chthoniobacterales bacterium]
MELLIIDPDPEHTDEVCAELLRDLADLPPNVLRAREGEQRAIADHTSEHIQKGDPITIGSIVISLVASGALTAALSKGGFLSKLATVLERYLTRTTKMKLVTKDGREVTIEGPSTKIETILRDALQRDSDS